LRYVDPAGEKLELTGSEKDREIGFQRIKEMVGGKAAKLLSVREENGHYYVDYRGKPGDGDRLAATAGAYSNPQVNSEASINVFKPANASDAGWLLILRGRITYIPKVRSKLQLVPEVKLERW
jgi:hypothetical protein